MSAAPSETSSPCTLDDLVQSGVAGQGLQDGSVVGSAMGCLAARLPRSGGRHAQELGRPHEVLNRILFCMMPPGRHAQELSGDAAQELAGALWRSPGARGAGR